MMSLFRMLKNIAHIHERGTHLLSINKRNLSYIYPHNARKDYPLADNKLRTKEALEAVSIPVPATFVVYSYFYQLQKLANDLASHHEFVIKPARGRAGGGIVVITGREGDDWLGINDKRYSLDDLKHHITEIIFGIYSFDMKDQAIIEERIIQHDDINALSPYGLADVRLILYRHEAVMAMARLPTLASGGRANIHQGAVGVGIDLATGMTTHALHSDQPVSRHPDTGSPLIDKQIPFWPQIMASGIAAARTMPLKYIGADIAITAGGPLIIELNVRPGLTIQSANDNSLLDRLESIDRAV